MKRLFPGLLLVLLTGCQGAPPAAEPEPPNPVLIIAPGSEPTEAAEEVAEPVPQVRRVTAMRIDVDVEDVDLNDLMDQIGRQVGWNILVDPKVQETVTISLRDVPWRDAVDIIAKLTRCEVVEIKPRVY